MAEPEPSPSSEPGSAEPSATAEPRMLESEARNPPNAEPHVDLSAVSEAWLILFKVHWITFAFCFAFLMLYNVYQLVKTHHYHRRKSMRNKIYMSTVHFLVIILGLSRALALCFWPYELTSNIPNLPHVIPRVLYALGFPCLFSGFTFVHKTFLKVSKIQMLPPGKLLNGKFMVLILAVHFAAVISTEIITSYVRGVQFLLLVCGFYYFVGCVGVSISLFFSGRKVIQRTRQIQQNLNAFKSQRCVALGFIKEDTVSLPSKRAAEENNPTISKVYKITATAVVFGLFGSLLHIYLLTWLFRRALNDSSATPSPWVWLVVNTFQRICEVVLTTTMTYAVCYNYKENACPEEVLHRSSIATSVGPLE